MSGADEKAQFLAAVSQSLADQTFVRLVLGKYRGDEDVEKIVASPVVIKGAAQIKFVTRRARKDVTQNFSDAEAVKTISAVLGQSFLSATLFSTERDVSLQFSKKRVARLTESKATFTMRPELVHDRAKAYQVDPAAPYLAALGVSDAKGAVKPSMFAKFKQISHFVEIVDDLIRDSELRDAKTVDAADIGSGKGYLTFALYDYLANTLQKTARVRGIEMRADLVTLCNDVARASSYSGLTFEARPAADIGQEHLDILMALHACDTATDDAIYQGISKRAALIVTAPCCQHELAPQIRVAGDLEGLLKFGLIRQRQADLVTDAARSLLLEASGYKVKVIEFVSTEHTAKNVMLAGIRSERVDREAALRQYAALKRTMGFESFHLERKLLAG